MSGIDKKWERQERIWLAGKPEVGFDLISFSKFHIIKNIDGSHMNKNTLKNYCQQAMDAVRQYFNFQ